MAIKSYTEQLAEVQTAIAQVEQYGQTYTFEGRSITRANLPDLYAREKWLRQMASREFVGGIVVQYGIRS